MNHHNGQVASTTLLRPSRRYERLIGIMLQHQMLDFRECERWAIYNFVATMCSRGWGRCYAMARAADEFHCSFEKVRAAVYKIEKQLLNNAKMNPSIKIRNEADCATIDIEGTIGLSEEWQFENPESRVATYERFKESVSQIADIENARIVVNIRSTGGDVNDAILIYEALRATGAQVTTCCYGYTASAATIVAQAASPGCRLVAPSSLYLIHNSLCSTEGNAEELQAEVEMLRQTDGRLAEIYASRSGRTVEQIAALMGENGGRGRWLSPAETIEAGLADGLIPESRNAAPQSDSVGERARRGILALLKSIGINGDESAVPDVANDINCILSDRPVAVAAERSAITLDEGQRSVKPTPLMAVEDPSPVESRPSARSIAYEQDVRALRNR